MSALRVDVLSHPMPSGLTWFAAYTAVGREYAAEGALRDAGMEAYCPTWTRFALRSKGLNGQKVKVPVRRPLFPRYVFVGASSLESWGPAARTEGVELLIRGAGDRPAIIPAATVAALRDAEALGQFDDTVKRQAVAPFRPGEPVRVLVGPFQGIVAEVIKADAKGRVSILLRLLGAERETRLKADQVESVK